MSLTLSSARFTNDTLLDECQDHITTLSGAMGVDARAKFASWSKLTTEATINTGSSLLHRLCAEQFRANPVLATCTGYRTRLLDRDSGAYGTLYTTEVTRYYNLATLTKDDASAKECIDQKGDWKAVDKDSDEYRAALRARGRRDMEKVLKTLGQ